MKKKILYFEKLSFQNVTLQVLKRKFNLIIPGKINKNDFNEIISIFLPMNDYYSEKFFKKFKNLRSVVTPTTGDIHLDKAYLKKNKIKILNLSNNKNKLKNITSTSEITIGHILNLTRKILFIHKNFVKTKEFRKYNNSLSNKMFTLGIVGMGRIGKHVAERAQSLGFNIIYFDPYVKIKKYKKIYNFKNFIKKNKYINHTYALYEKISK